MFRTINWNFESQLSYFVNSCMQKTFFAMQQRQTCLRQASLGLAVPSRDTLFTFWQRLLSEQWKMSVKEIRNKLYLQMFFLFIFGEKRLVLSRLIDWFFWFSLLLTWDFFFFFQFGCLDFSLWSSKWKYLFLRGKHMLCLLWLLSFNKKPTRSTLCRHIIVNAHSLILPLQTSSDSHCMD